MIGSTSAEKEQCLDSLRDPAFCKVFIGHFKQRREQLLEELVDNGGDEPRFKVQMIDEILAYEIDLYEEWKTEKQSAN